MGDEVEVEEDIEELLDFDNVPKFRTSKEEVKYWKGKAKGIKYWYEKVKKRLDKYEKGHEGKQNGDISLLPPLVNGNGSVGGVSEEEGEEQEHEEVQIQNGHAAPVSPAPTVYMPRRSRRRFTKAGNGEVTSEDEVKEDEGDDSDVLPATPVVKRKGKVISSSESSPEKKAESRESSPEKKAKSRESSPEKKGKSKDPKEESDNEEASSVTTRKKRSDAKLKELKKEQEDKDKDKTVPESPEQPKNKLLKVKLRQVVKLRRIDSEKEDDPSDDDGRGKESDNVNEKEKESDNEKEKEAESEGDCRPDSIIDLIPNSDEDEGDKLEIQDITELLPELPLLSPGPFTPPDLDQQDTEIIRASDDEEENEVENKEEESPVPSPHPQKDIDNDDDKKKDKNKKSSSKTKTMQSITVSDSEDADEEQFFTPEENENQDSPKKKKESPTKTKDAKKSKSAPFPKRKSKERDSTSDKKSIHESVSSTKASVIDSDDDEAEAEVKAKPKGPEKKKKSESIKKEKKTASDIEEEPEVNNGDDDTAQILSSTNVKSEADSSSSPKPSKDRKPQNSDIDLDTTATADDSLDVSKSLPVREIVDAEKPSTSKKVARELRRMQRSSGQDKKKLTRAEAAARRGILQSSSEDEEFEKEDRLKQRQQRKKEKKKSRSSISSETEEKPVIKIDVKTDPKLNGEAVVELQTLAPEILTELQTKGFITVPETEEPEPASKNNKKAKDSADDDDEDSDSLERAIMDLRRYNARVKEKKDEQLKKAKARSKKNLINGDSDEALLKSQSQSDEDDEEPKIKIKSMHDILDPSAISDMEDIKEEASGDEDEKEKKKRAGDGEKKKKDYKLPRVDIFDSDDAGKEVVLSDDSDSDFKKKSTRRRKKSGASSDSDSDFVSSTSKKRKRRVRSDSDFKNSSDEDSDEFVSTSKSKKKSGKRGHSSSDPSDADSDDKKSKKDGKKKRRRIKELKDSDDSGGHKSDSDVQEVTSSQGKGTKQIRKIMSKNKLQKSTREAEKEEEERKKRIAERQKLYNGAYDPKKAAHGAKVTEVVLEWDDEKKPIIEVDKSIVKQLKPHQVDGIRFMYTSCFESLEMMKEGKGGGCILAHCMGLGKTLQTIAFAYTMYKNREITKMRRALIVVPLNTVGNWLKEFQQWLSDVDDFPPLHSLWDTKNINQRVDALRAWEKRGGFGIINYELFRLLVNSITAKGKARGTKPKKHQLDIIRSSLIDPGPDLIVCDEGHLLKNHKSKLSEALNQIKSIRRIMLTGTPLQNNLVEYHTMVDFVKPNLLGSLKEFRNRFENPIKAGQNKDSDSQQVRIMKRRAHVLHSKLNGCVHRLDYSVLTPYLPPKYEYCVVINLSDKQKALYKDYLDKVVTPDVSGGGMTMSIGMRVLQHYATLIKIIAHPVVLSMKKAVERTTSDEEEDDESLKDFICDDEEEESTTPASSDDEIECLDKGKTKPKRKTRSCKDDPKDEDSNSNMSEKAQKNGNGNGLGNDWWCSHFEKKEDLYDTNLSGKLVVLQQILKVCEAIGDRILIFSQFLTTLDIIEEFLAEWDKEAEEKAKEDNDEPLTFPANLTSKPGRWRKNLEYFRIDGQTKTNDRQKNCETFNKKTAGKSKLFLISTRAGGLGINLFGANRVVIFDASWNPSNDMQSIFRAYRLGQTKPVYIYRFVSRATMEEKIYNRQVVKLSLSSRVVDEHQVDRHFRNNDIEDMLDFYPDKKSDRPTPPVPKDRVLADLLISHKEWVDAYFEHDSLLANKEEETLTEEERRQAWEEYQNESSGIGLRVHQPQQNSGEPNDQVTYFHIRIRLRERFPDATEEQLNASAAILMQKIQEMRGFNHRLNDPRLPQAQRLELSSKIARIQDWIVRSIGGQAVPGPHQAQQAQAFVQQQFNVNPPVPRPNIINRGRGMPMTLDAQAIQRQMANIAGVNQAAMANGFGGQVGQAFRGVPMSNRAAAAAMAPAARSILQQRNPPNLIPVPAPAQQAGDIIELDDD